MDNIPLHSFDISHRLISVENIGDSRERMFYPAHRHDFYELIFFTKGIGTHRIDFADYPVAPNLIYFMSPGQIHEMKLQGREGYVISFSKELLYHIQILEDISFGPLFYHPDNEFAVDISIGDHATFYKLISLLENETTKVIQNQNLIRNYMSAFLISSLDYSNFSSSNERKDRIMKLRMEIDKSFISERSGRYYAEKLNLSLKHLNDLTNNTLGKTVTQLIHERILLEAKRGIAYTDKSIKEMSYELGFKDPAYFNRFFKKLMGKTPDEFRKISK